MAQSQHPSPSKVKFNRFMLSLSNRLDNQRLSIDQTINVVWSIFAGNWNK